MTLLWLLARYKGQNPLKWNVIFPAIVICTVKASAIGLYKINAFGDQLDGGTGLIAIGCPFILVNLTDNGNLGAFVQVLDCDIGKFFKACCLDPTGLWQLGINRDSHLLDYSSCAQLPCCKCVA